MGRVVDVSSKFKDVVYADATVGDKHGIMQCTACNTPITNGQYRARQKSKHYVTHHRACCAGDPYWAVLDNLAVEARERELKIQAEAEELRRRYTPAELDQLCELLYPWEDVIMKPAGQLSVTDMGAPVSAAGVPVVAGRAAGQLAVPRVTEKEEAEKPVAEEESPAAARGLSGPLGVSPHHGTKERALVLLAARTQGVTSAQFTEKTGGVFHTILWNVRKRGAWVVEGEKKSADPTEKVFRYRLQGRVRKDGTVRSTAAFMTARARVQTP